MDLTKFMFQTKPPGGFAYFRLFKVGHDHSMELIAVSNDWEHIRTMAADLEDFDVRIEGIPFQCGSLSID